MTLRVGGGGRLECRARGWRPSKVWVPTPPVGRLVGPQARYYCCCRCCGAGHRWWFVEEVTPKAAGWRPPFEC